MIGIRTAIGAGAIAMGLFGPSAACGQAMPDPEVLKAAQREAVAKLASLDGEWRGPAWVIEPGMTEKKFLTQTERVGSMLDGTVKVIEGRGYEADGRLAFNAFAIIGFDPAKRAYTMRTHAQGRQGDFSFSVTPEGFVWELPAGPFTVRYTIVIKDGTWHEVGDRLGAGKEPLRFFETTLKRIGDSSWPASGFVGMR